MAKPAKPPENGAEAAGARRKTCFVVSEFGRDEATRLERKQTLKHLIRKVLEPMGYTVQRADDIEDLGQITHQIIERLLDDDLVVADLTGLNPNVFYELAVRHAARRPVITLMTEGQTIPFDLKDVRTIFYDLRNPDSLEAAQEELARKVAAIEADPSDVRNPITVARNVTLLQQSNDPEAQAAGEVLVAVNDLRDEVRMLSRRVANSDVRTTDDSRDRGSLTDLIRAAIASSRTSLTTAELATAVGYSPSVVRRVAQEMAQDPGEWGVWLVEGKWTDIPF